ncbi:hypothetical protein [Nocardia barduliensis]|uniref:hypothetical protein n=1 Tax=Nocardia barduliensis TaxID=2736643 RepID=UPI0015738727|nr:hypothetical protein [Nocardia barduliensis]
MVFLAAALLIMPIIDCALLGRDGHSHPTAIAEQHLTRAVSEDLSHGAFVPADDACDPFTAQCFIRPVLHGGFGDAATLHLIAFVLTAVFIAVGLAGSAGGVRAPPIGFRAAVSGRATLTQFCISRR